uniref:Uncharacterized protein n=1 Tax=Cucumis melo TaxID=3656 RepID=A0A9I9E077_CUCME
MREEASTTNFVTESFDDGKNTCFGQGFTTTSYGEGKRERWRWWQSTGGRSRGLGFKEEDQ